MVISSYINSKETNDKNIQRPNKYTIEIKKVISTLVNYNISSFSIERDYGITKKTIREIGTKKEEILKEKKIKNTD